MNTYIYSKLFNITLCQPQYTKHMYVSIQLFPNVKYYNKVKVTVLLMSEHYTRWRCDVILTHQPLYTHEKRP